MKPGARTRTSATPLLGVSTLAGTRSLFASGTEVTGVTVIPKSCCRSSARVTVWRPGGAVCAAGSAGAAAGARAPAGEGEPAGSGVEGPCFRSSGIGTRSMWQMGHWPGSADRICGCIEQ